MRIDIHASIACLLLGMACGLATAQPAALQPASAQASVQKAIPIQEFLRSDSFNRIKLSPTGKYIARSADIVDESGAQKTVLVIQDRVTGKRTGHFNLSGKTQVQDFWWVNDERVLISVGEKFGLLEQPQPTGELYATNADGSGQAILVGQRAGEDTTASHIKLGKERDAVAAFMVEDQPRNAKNAIISVSPIQGEVMFTRAEEMDVYTGHRAVVAIAPVRRADFTTDLQGVVRFAKGSGADNLSKTYYRDNANSEWQLLNDQSVSKRNLTPLGFSADGRTAYLEKEEEQGPNGIYAYDTTTRAMTLQLRDPVADPAWILRGPANEVLGAQYIDGKSKVVFFDENSTLSKEYRSLEASFQDQVVRLDDFTSDGKIAMVKVYSDRSPGDYYLLDLDSKKAAHLASRYDWLDPDRMGVVRPITLTARDGMALHGYLTLPPGSNGKNLPLVVNPHGGPFDEFDGWEFNWETQLLASRGYAVLQVNFRGSGNYGRAFALAGYKQWGGAMQDDVTDATRWAIQQGIADAHRICIYGASYGGYAALMGVAKEPSLYRCAIGYAGVYDLPSMYTTGPVQETHWGRNYRKDTLGEENLEAISPDHLAERITVPVMLVAGSEDEIAPPKHTEMMRDALQKAGKSVDAKIYDKEGHGFFIDADKLDFYTRMLAFLDRNIGAAAGATH
jgi:dipeptidyl aminopeptidase/acylaminoacyl peptidase